MTVDDNLRGAAESLRATEVAPPAFIVVRRRRRVRLAGSAAIAVAVLAVVGIAAATASGTSRRVSVTSATSSSIARSDSATTSTALAATTTTTFAGDVSSGANPGAGEGGIGATPSTPPPVRPPAGIVVSPDEGLPERRFVTVTGSGFPANTRVFVRQCVASTSNTKGYCDPFWWSQNDDEAYTDGSGTLTAMLRPVRRVLADGSDCSTVPGRCEIVVWTNDVFLRNPLAFAGPSGPERPMTLQAEPSADLVDGQQVRVTGHDLMPSDGYLYQCVNGRCGQGGQRVTVAPDGTLDVMFTVRRRFPDGNPPYDCDVDACTIATGQFGFVGAPISFARSSSPTTNSRP